MLSSLPPCGGYNTDQKKPNRERICERERNGYRTGTRTRTERVQNGYRTDTERIQNGYRTDTERKWNGYGTVTNHKNGKKRSPERKL